MWLVWIAVPLAAEAPVIPLTPCELLRDLPAQEGKDIAILGRYSFREKGRWISEQTCGTASDAPSGVPLIWLVEDAAAAPKPPGQFELDGAAVQRKWTQVQRRTELGKFRFGTPDYDRWAVIWGRLQARKGDEARTAAANLIYRGGGVIFYLTQ